MILTMMMTLAEVVERSIKMMRRKERKSMKMRSKERKMMEKIWMRMNIIGNIINQLKTNRSQSLISNIIRYSQTLKTSCNLRSSNLISYLIYIDLKVKCSNMKRRSMMMRRLKMENTTMKKKKMNI